jgi:hypothetical protein
MYSEYFDAKVTKTSIEPRHIVTIQRSGFLGLTKIKTDTQIDEYFIYCKIERTLFTFKIVVSGKIFEQARAGDDVSIHLKFVYEFACFHFAKEDRKDKILEVSQNLLGDE